MVLNTKPYVNTWASTIMPENSQPDPPEQRAPQPTFLTKIQFDHFELAPEVLNGLQKGNFNYCTPIQGQVLPVALMGNDIAGQAQTGTGKTAAFLVTILSRLVLVKQPSGAPARAIILAPTRELAYQIYDEAQVIGQDCHLKMAKVVGGVDYQGQTRLLQKGVDIIIGTPGRIIDFIKQGVIKTGAIQAVVIDEADRLLDLGFAKDMRYILGRMPHYTKRQTMLFSATLSYRVLELTYEFMNLPEFISVTPEEVTVEGIDQSLFHIGDENKLPLLLGLLKREDWGRMLIFVNTKVGVEWLTLKLKGNGWPVEGITGDLPQRKRFRLMEQFKKGQIKVLIATDVASRGIHVEDISHVINYDLPQDSENYVHRIGRTARAGKTGKAISLACERYVFHLEALESMLNYKIPVVWPEDDWMVEDVAGPVPVNRKPRRTRPTRKQRSTPKPPIKGPRKRPFVTKSAYPGAFFGFGPPDKPPSPPAPQKKTAARPHTTKPRRQTRQAGKRPSRSRPKARAKNKPRSQ
jgi:ATP-dependent RNA helicase RhlB